MNYRCQCNCIGTKTFAVNWSCLMTGGLKQAEEGYARPYSGCRLWGDCE